MSSALKPIAVSLPGITIPVVEKDTRYFTGQWYKFVETIYRRVGGEQGDNVAALSADIITLDTEIGEINATLLTKADKATTATAGNGLTGGGTLGADFTFDAKQNTGWTTGTGTGNKGSYSTYAGQTVSLVYVAAEAQATDDAVKANSQRLFAIEQALRLNGAID